VSAGTPRTGQDNAGATEQTGEDLACGSNAPLGSTVWYRFTAPNYGTATFLATGTGGMDSVMQVFRGSSTTPGACNDDAPNLIGPSRVRMRVTPGTYFIQVGGFAGRQFGFNLSAEFDVILDWDGDRRNRGTDDCNDFNRAIYRGAPDRRGNGVDENCDGVDGQRFDRDEDSYFSNHPNTRQRDCRDNNPRINPGRREIRGNKVDENCDGIALPRRNLPGIPLNVRFFISPRSEKVTSFLVRTARRARVTVTCKGRGCPRRRTRRANRRGTANFRKYFRRKLRVGATINIRSTKRGRVGRWARIKYGKSGVRGRKGCLRRNSRTRRIRCPKGTPP
jgi:hypothetical protein